MENNEHLQHERFVGLPSPAIEHATLEPPDMHFSAEVLTSSVDATTRRVHVERIVGGEQQLSGSQIAGAIMIDLSTVLGGMGVLQSPYDYAECSRVV